MTYGRTVYTCKVAAIVAALALLALAGCSSDDSTTPDPGPPAYKWPDTREDLMDNFERAYDEMNYEEYEACLHPDFRFIFNDLNIWKRAQDLTSTQNMFAGNQGHTEHGEVVLGVQSIAVNTFNQIGAWDTQDPDHPDFPGSDQGLFDIQIVFYLQGGEYTLTVTSEQLFYLKSEDVDDGESGTRTRWFLIGQRDLGEGWKGNEDMTWGDIKALY